MRAPLPLLLAFSVGCALSGCGAVQVPAEREDAFTAAVAAQRAGRPVEAMAAAYGYVREATVDDPRYDRALRLLALAAEDLGLRHAASLWFLEVARGRRAPALLPEAIRGLQRALQGPHDADALVTGYLAVADIPGLPEDLQGFVDFQQGLHAARQGLDDWADTRFARLPPGSQWADRAEYVRAVRLVSVRALPAARALLERLLARGEVLPRDLALDVRRSLARLDLHAGDFSSAIEHFRLLQAEAPGDPELLLEMAWAHYQAGDTRRTLGLLLALDAPIYSDLIAPDRFLLEALALRRLCQFSPARAAAVRLDEAHGAALRDLYAGVPALRSPSLRVAARRRPEVKPLSDLAQALEAE
ncbi:MAG: hypothetical protein KC613_21850, partial [Myxococcales bacterium]|nr:hypothetical protein [Myxococcales bacterium]